MQAPALLRPQPYPRFVRCNRGRPGSHSRLQGCLQAAAMLARDLLQLCSQCLKKAKTLHMPSGDNNACLGLATDAQRCSEEEQSMMRAHR